MTTGELARQAGVNVETLRFYERSHLLRKPPRTISGYRVYGDSDLKQVQFIRECQGLGFTLRDIKQLNQLHSALSAGPKAASQRADLTKLIAIAEQRLHDIKEKIASLQRMRTQLSDMVQQSSQGADAQCPVRHPLPGEKAPKPKKLKI